MTKNPMDEYRDWLNKAAGSSSNFLKLKDDGADAVVAFCNDHRFRSIHWTGQQSEVCRGPGCALCLSERPKQRVLLNIAVKTDAGWVPKVLDQGPAFMRNLVSVFEKFPQDKYSYSITRRGGAGDPKTTFVILPQDVLSDDEWETINALDLIDLDEFCKPSDTNGAEDTSGGTPF